MRKILVAIGLGLLAAPALANPPNQPTLMALKGHCTSIVLLGQVLKPEFCNQKLVNMTLPNGREGFLFTLQGPGKPALTIGFFGDGQREIHKDRDHVVLPIDSMDVSFEGLHHHVAAGSCQFANPTQGVPVAVSCTAESAEGKFVAEFMSDGSAPIL